MAIQATIRLERFNLRSSPSKMSSFLRLIAPVPDLRHHPNKIHKAGNDTEQQKDDFQGRRTKPSVEQIAHSVTDQDRYREDQSHAHNEIELLKRAPFVVLFAIHATF